MARKIILGIETSCDETGAAVLEKKGNRITILSNIVASSASLQAKYGGIIPEQAAREQIKSIIPVIKESLQTSGIRPQDLDSIAVTYGPGLIGSLLVGVETAKTLALTWGKPLIAVNHLIGHFYANWIQSSAISYQLSDKKQKRSDDRRLMTDDYPSFPCIGLLVSGGHTDLVLFKSHGKYQHLGGTRDDAAGECFDKCARLLGLPYPGGPQVSKLAEKGDPNAYKLPRPMIDSGDFDFSFSGLKTAVSNLIKTMGGNEFFNNLAASVEQAIIDVLVKKTVEASKVYRVDQIILAGGVAANQKLCLKIDLAIQRNFEPKTHVRFLVPPAYLCTDNAAMIASAAFFTGKRVDPLKLQADPNLSLAY